METQYLIPDVGDVRPRRLLAEENVSDILYLASGSFRQGLIHELRARWIVLPRRRLRDSHPGPGDSHRAVMR